MNLLIQNFTRQLKDIHTSRLWMGANFQGKLELVSEEEAFMRPLPDLHSVAEVLDHLALYAGDTARKIQEGNGVIESASGNAWRSNDELRKEGWDALIERYHRNVNEVISLLESKDDAFLEQTYEDPDFKGKFPYRFCLDGMLHHSIYHLGQIGLIIKLLKLN